MGSVNKIDQPLLVIGLGGTGFDAVMRIKREFRDRFVPEKLKDGSALDRPPRTRFLVIDTDSGTASKSRYGMTLDKNAEFIDISADLQAVKASGLPAYISEWFDNSVSTADINKNGAGVYRQIARLFLFKKAREVRTKFTAALKDLISVEAAKGGDTSVAAKVYFIAGISGGTGSGILLDSAYLLRHTIMSHETMAGFNAGVEFNGMVVMPDVTIGHHAQANETLRKLYSANSYAALKELDFWMNQPQHQQPFTQKYDDGLQISWDWPPFKDVTMVCASNEKGVPINRPYDRGMDIMAELLANIYAEESKAPKPDGSVNAQSYWSAISNHPAQKSQTRKTYPVSYCYNAIGAYSSAGDEQATVSVERQLVYSHLDSFVLHNSPSMDGDAPSAFYKDAYGEQESKYRKSYDNRYPIPKVFDNEQNYDIDSMRRTSPNDAPHGKTFTSFQRNIKGNHGDEREGFIGQLWSDFVKAARAVMEDPKRGPSYLFTLLNTAETGFRALIKQHITELEGKKARCDGDLERSTPPTDGGSLVQQKYSVFLNAPRLLGIGAQKEFDDYRNTTRTRLYEAQRASAYYRAQLEALEEYMKQLNLFISVLGDFNAALFVQTNLYEEEARNTDKAKSSLFDQNKVRESLTQEFAKEQVSNTIIRGVLASIADEIVAVTQHSMRIDPDAVGAFVDEHTDRLASEQFNHMLGAMTLEQRMVAYGAVNGDMLSFSKDRLAPDLDGGALLMLATADEFRPLDDQNCTRFSYVSVPSGAGNIYAGFHAFLAERGKNEEQNLCVNETTDSLFWVNTAFGLPLMAYRPLKEIKDKYDEVKASHKCMHLRMLSRQEELLENDDRVMNHWFELPDPFINRNAFVVDENETLLREAVGLGLIRIDCPIGYDDTHAENLSQKVYRSKEAHYVTLTEMENRIATAKAASDSPYIRLQALEQIAADQQTSDIHIEGLRTKAEKWGEVLSQSGEHSQVKYLIGRPVLPAMPKADQEAIRQAWQVCYEKAVFEALCRRPPVVAAMRRNVACAKLIQAEVSAAREEIAKLVFTDVRRAAMLRIFDLVQLRPASVIYRDLGGNWEHQGSDNVLYSLTDPSANDPLRAMHKAFDRIDISLRFALWLAVHSQEQVTQGLADRLKSQQETLSRKADKDAETDTIVARAKEIVAKMKELEVTIDHQYDTIGDQEAFNFYRRCINETTDAMQSFLSIWAR